MLAVAAVELIILAEPPELVGPVVVVPVGFMERAVERETVLLDNQAKVAVAVAVAVEMV
jgi:hypothetical protein